MDPRFQQYRMHSGPSYDPRLSLFTGFFVLFYFFGQVPQTKMVLFLYQNLGWEHMVCVATIHFYC